MRRQSRTQGRSINDIVLEALERGLSVDRTCVRYRDLSGVVGTWVADPDFDLALLDQDRVDEERKD